MRMVNEDTRRAARKVNGRSGFLFHAEQLDAHLFAHARIDVCPVDPDRGRQLRLIPWDGRLFLRPGRGIQ